MEAGRLLVDRYLQQRCAIPPAERSSPGQSLCGLEVSPDLPIQLCILRIPYWYCISEKNKGKLYNVIRSTLIENMQDYVLFAPLNLKPTIKLKQAGFQVNYVTKM